MAYRYSIGLQGNLKKDKTSLVFDIGTPADHVAALSAANQIRGALVDITKAFVRYEYLTDIVSEDGTRPTDESADCFEEARVTTYLDATGDKLHTIRIPAPIAALLVPDGSGNIDITNADLIQYVQQISQHAFVSDGEVINTTITNGIKEGKVISVAKNLKV